MLTLVISCADVGDIVFLTVVESWVGMAAGVVDVELSYHSKHLLLAAYLAAHSPPQRDVATFSLTHAGECQYISRGAAKLLGGLLRGEYYSCSVFGVFGALASTPRGNRCCAMWSALTNALVEQLPVCRDMSAFLRPAVGRVWFLRVWFLKFITPGKGMVS